MEVAALARKEQKQKKEDQRQKKEQKIVVIARMPRKQKQPLVHFPKKAVAVVVVARKTMNRIKSCPLLLCCYLFWLLEVYLMMILMEMEERLVFFAFCSFVQNACIQELCTLMEYFVNLPSSYLFI